MLAQCKNAAALVNRTEASQPKPTSHLQGFVRANGDGLDDGLPAPMMETGEVEAVNKRVCRVSHRLSVGHLFLSDNQSRNFTSQVFLSTKSRRSIFLWHPEPIASIEDEEVGRPSPDRPITDAKTW
jgi:hypothetical protein